MKYSVMLFINHPSYNVLWHDCTDNIGASYTNEIVLDLIQKIRDTVKNPRSPNSAYVLFDMFFPNAEELKKNCVISLKKIDGNQDLPKDAQILLEAIAASLKQAIKNNEKRVTEAV